MILRAWTCFSNAYKRFACWMKWHSGSYEIKSFDGCSIHAKCRWCG